MVLPLAPEPTLGLVARPIHFPFMATCPKCKELRAQGVLFYRRLIQLLDDNQPIHGRCTICGHTWAVNDEDRSRLAKEFAPLR